MAGPSDDAGPPDHVSIPSVAPVDENDLLQFRAAHTPPYKARIKHGTETEDIDVVDIRGGLGGRIELELPNGKHVTLQPNTDIEEVWQDGV